MTTHYDAIVIGTGQSGPYIAGRLAGAGMKMAVIERKLFGGTCVNTGCIPTKTMIASAQVAYLARRAAEYGVHAGEVTVDLRKVKARKDAISGQNRQWVEQWLAKMDNCTVYRGHARLDSPRVVSVGGERLEAGRIFLNVGARARIPSIQGLDQTPYLTNSSLLDLEDLPSHLLIVGGGYVGLEFAQMFRRFGSQVTVVEMGPRLAEHEDEDVSAAIQDILQAEGVNIRTNAKCIAVQRQNGDIRLQMECSQGPPVVSGSHLLIAVGRRPNTDDLGLENAGVKTNPRGFIQVDDQLLTSADGVWATGDCNGRGAFTHTSYNDYEIVVANLLDHEHRSVNDRIEAYALYIDPPLGRAGMTLAAAQASGRHVLVGQRPMTRVGRAVEKGQTRGFMRILVDAQSSQILGATILGSDGDEAIHCILDVMYCKAPYTTLRRAMHIHPTVSELIPTVLGELHELEPAAQTAQQAA